MPAGGAIQSDEPVNGVGKERRSGKARKSESDKRAKNVENEKEAQNEARRSALATIAEWWRQYWFEYRISYALLVFFRFVFFGAFAFDCWTHIHRAVKYAHLADFNVSHLPPSVEAHARALLSFLVDSWPVPLQPALGSLSSLVTASGQSLVSDWPLLRSYWASLSFLPPSQASLVLCWALMTFVSLRVAFGQFRRWELFLLAGLQWYHYLSSQLNLYQHEYLLAILLVLWCFVDWDRAETEAHRAKGGRSKMFSAFVRCWPMRLIIVQTALLYFWTAVAKMNPVWLSPDFLPSLFSPRITTVLDAHIHPLLASSGVPLISALSAGHMWHLAAVSVIVVELLLTAMLLAAPGPWLNAFLFPFGVGLHLSMEASGLQIGHFSYFMAVLYLLLLPDRLASALSAAMALCARVSTRAGRVYDDLRPRVLFIPIDFVLSSACVVGGHLFVWNRLRFEKPALISFLMACDAVLFVCATAFALAGGKKRKRGSSGLVALGLVFLLCCGTLVLFEAQTQQYVKMNETGSQDALKMGNLTLAVAFLEEAAAAASPPSADMVADLAILHEGLAAGKEGPHDAASARYYDLALRIDGDNIKALVGRLRRVDREKATANQHGDARGGMCEEIEKVGRKAEAVVRSGCGYFDAAECETVRGFARNYVLQRVLPQLSRKWGCSG